MIGVDIDEASLMVARSNFPNRSFQYARGEELPFPDASFDRVVSAVALPYMDIPKTLAEVRRVLAPGGAVFFSVHALRFTLKEMKNAMPRPVPVLFRGFVIFNGLWLHCTGRVLNVAGRTESFQTKRGMERALARAGFVDLVFTRPDGRLLVEARRGA